MIRGMCRVLTLLIVFSHFSVQAVQANDKTIDLPVDKPEYNPAQPQGPTSAGNPISPGTVTGPVRVLPVPPPPPPPKTPPPEEKPPTIYGQEIKSENNTIIYVLDISGSMDWDVNSYTRYDGRAATGPRIDRAKSELIKSIHGLPQSFYFNIVTYDCSIFSWLPGNQMAKATPDQKLRAIQWVINLKTGGGTGTGPAVATALSPKKNKLVVLLTDGDPNCGADGFEGHKRTIKAANTQGAVINTYGIAAGYEMKRFLQEVANENGGTYTDVH